MSEYECVSVCVCVCDEQFVSRYYLFHASSPRFLV